MVYDLRPRWQRLLHQRLLCRLNRHCWTQDGVSHMRCNCCYQRREDRWWEGREPEISVSLDGPAAKIEPLSGGGVSPMDIPIAFGYGCLARYAVNVATKTTY